MTSEADCFTRTLNAEERLLEMSGLPLDNFERKFTEIEIDGAPFQVRTIIYGGDSGQKKTLVMTHGFLLSAVCFWKILKKLSEHYRLVLFDNMGNGLNTQRQECPALHEGIDACEDWMIEWWTKLIDALDLPEKFLLAAHSIGGYQAMLYASQHPERIESLFLISPACTEPYIDSSYDPYSYPDPLNPTQVQPRDQVDKAIQAHRDKESPFHLRSMKLPGFVVDKAARYAMPKLQSGLTEEEANAYAEYMANSSFKRDNITEAVVYQGVRHSALARHPLQAEDRLGNKAVNFPIAMTFGETDFFGTEGADMIIRNNEHYQSGRSQLFKVKDSGHCSFWDQPDALCEQMVGFFEGTLTGHFELQPRRRLLPGFVQPTEEQQ